MNSLAGTCGCSVSDRRACCFHGDANHGPPHAAHPQAYLLHVSLFRGPSLIELGISKGSPAGDVGADVRPLFEPVPMETRANHLTGVILSPGAACAEISCWEFEGPGQGNTNAAERSYSSQAALCVWGVDHTKRPRLAGCKGRGRWRRVCFSAHLGRFPAAIVTGVDQIRCSVTNFKFRYRLTKRHRAGTPLGAAP